MNPSHVRRAAQAVGVAAAVGLALFVSGYPFTVVEYPHLGDLPMHASSSAVLRHFADPAWHFREQFTFEWLKSPYWTYLVLGALFNLVLPIAAAMRLATVICLLLLPAGLAVLFRGLKKSPLLGLLGLSLSWSALTHWGFVNFVAASGLFAMAIGATLLVLDAPSRLRIGFLAVVMALVLATHVSRYPYALVAVLGTTVLLYPATRRFEEVLMAVMPSLALGLVWLFVRERILAPPVRLSLEPQRLLQLGTVLGGGDKIPGQLAVAHRVGATVLVVFFASTIAFVRRRPWRRWSRQEAWWHGGATVAVLACVLGFLAMYLTLPMSLGNWFYVYPREGFCAALMLLGLVPDLPRSTALRALLLAPFAWATVSTTLLVADHFVAFEHEIGDFLVIQKRVPPAPRLAHVVLDPHGPHEAELALVHLPMWIQAEKGGWSSFHFAVWRHAPLRYRADGAQVPPRLEPMAFTMDPEVLDLPNRGRFYDDFLVYSKQRPDRLLVGDSSIHLVATAGSWWLYERDAAGKRALGR